MKREIITITEPMDTGNVGSEQNYNGSVSAPGEIRMTIAEIADLFGVFYQTAKGAVRAIQKSGVADGDYSMCCAVAGSKVHPEYYGLEMITAVAFRVQSPKAKVFRRWVQRKCCRSERMPIFVYCNRSACIN